MAGRQGAARAGRARPDRQLIAKSVGQSGRARFNLCEQVFFGRPVVIAPDLAHSGIETRYAALGKTHADRRLSVVFTVRDTLVRVISARDMSRKDRRIYAQVDAAQ